MDRDLEPGSALRAGVVLAGALAIGIAAYGLSSQTSTYSYLGPLGRMETLREPGFDVWTGMPHGSTFRLRDCPPEGIGPDASWTIDQCEIREVTDRAPPDDMSGRRALPLPIGAVIGAFVMLAVIAIGDRLARWPPTRP